MLDSSVYFIYIDESGTPEIKDNSRRYILSSVIIEENDWSNIDKSVNDLKLKWFPDEDPRDFEFHLRDITHRKGHFKRKTDAELKNICYDIYELISVIPCTIISVIINKGLVFNPRKIEFIANKFLLERLYKYLFKYNKQDKGIINYGLLVFDKINNIYDSNRRKMINLIRKQITGNEDRDFIVEIPIYADSNYRSGLQIADAIAYCLQQTYSRSVRRKSLFQTYFEKIKPKFDVNSKGTYDGAGLKIFPREKDQKSFLEA